MNSRKHIVIIGGTACGPKAGARARRCDPQAQITIIEQGGNLSTATCGLPYYVSGVIENQASLVAVDPNFFGDVLGIEVFTATQALAVDRQAHRVELLDVMTKKTSSIPYDKLVLATGSLPAVPPLEGRDLGGIFTLTKIKDANAIRKQVLSRSNGKVVIIGAGLIGLEMAEAFVSRGMEVTVVEALNWVLPGLLDFEIAAPLERHLRSKGVNLLLGQPVARFEGDGSDWVSKAITSNSELKTGLVLLALGARPNVQLAKDAGLSIGATRGIAVNEYLQTSDPDIYAGGDCVENVNRINQRKVLVPLGSTANKHGRVIGTNITGGSETFPGVLGTTVVKVFDFNVARVGLTESQARESGYEVVTCLTSHSDHAGYYPGGNDILVKLVAEKPGGRLLGGQIVGQGDSAKRIDVLATAITFGATADNLANVDLGYAPPYNSAMDPLHHAANVIRNKLSGQARALTPIEVKSKLDDEDDFILLDVRTPEEWESYYIEAKQTRRIPLGELRTNLEKLPKNAEIVIYCLASIRAYQAQCILAGAGFENVKFMDGSIAGWPYAITGIRPE